MQQAWLEGGIQVLSPCLTVAFLQYDWLVADWEYFASLSPDYTNYWVDLETWKLEMINSNDVRPHWQIWKPDFVNFGVTGSDDVTG